MHTHHHTLARFWMKISWITSVHIYTEHSRYLSQFASCIHYNNKNVLRLCMRMPEEHQVKRGFRTFLLILYYIIHIIFRRDICPRDARGPLLLWWYHVIYIYIYIRTNCSIAPRIDQPAFLFSPMLPLIQQWKCISYVYLIYILYTQSCRQSIFHLSPFRNKNLLAFN